MGNLLSRIAFVIYSLLQKKRIRLCLPCHPFDAHEVNGKYTLFDYLVMGADEARNQAYRNVIDRTVKDLRVVEIGTGALAVLAEMCIEAGCAKVYAIEENRKSAARAKKKMRKMGLEGRVEVIEGFSTDIVLPGKGDALVFEIIGDIAGSEGAARVIDDARKRLVNPDAAIIPQSCATVVVPTGPLRLSLFDRWWSRAVHRKVSIEKGRHCLVTNFPPDIFLASPQTCESIDFQDIRLLQKNTCSFIIDRKSEFSGFAFGNRVSVDRHNVIESLYQQTSWLIPYLPLFDPPLPLEKGDAIDITLACDLRTVSPEYQLTASVFRSGTAVIEDVKVEWSGALQPIF